MRRTRSTASAAAEPLAHEPPPGAGPSLPEALEVLRGPGVVRSDVDAFLGVLARPPSGGETPRARADLLLSVLEDARVRDFIGGDWLTVRSERRRVRPG